MNPGLQYVLPQCIHAGAGVVAQPAVKLVVLEVMVGFAMSLQMLARVCPTAMVFVPSVDGISHNPAEHTHEPDLEHGANVLLQTMVALANNEPVGANP